MNPISFIDRLVAASIDAPSQALRRPAVTDPISAWLYSPRSLSRAPSLSLLAGSQLLNAFCRGL